MKVNWSEDCAVAEVVDCMSSDGGDTSEGGSTREIEDGGECLIHLRYLLVNEFSCVLV